MTTQKKSSKPLILIHTNRLTIYWPTNLNWKKFFVDECIVQNITCTCRCSHIWYVYKKWYTQSFLFLNNVTCLVLYTWLKKRCVLASNSLFKQTFIKGTMCLKGLSRLWTTLTWTPHVVKNENQRYTSDTSRNLLQFCLLFHSIFDFYWNSVSVWVFFYSCYNIISFHHIWFKTVWCRHISCVIIWRRVFYWELNHS